MSGYRIYIVLIIALISRSIFSQSYLPPEVLSLDHGLSSRNVNCIYVDKKGFLWAATDYGLNRYDGYYFRQFFTSEGDLHSPKGQVIKTLKSDRWGNLWIISNSGLNLYDNKTGDITFYSASSFDTIPSGTVSLRDLCPDAEGRIWLLTDHTLTQFVPGQLTKSYPIPVKQFKEGSVTTCMLPDNNGNIWIGTSDGILVFNIQQNLFMEFMTQNSQGLLSDHYINCMFLDNEKSLWIGTKNGLNRFDPVDYDFEELFPANSHSPQPANEIHCITHDEDGRLVIATGEGIVLLNYPDRIFTKVYKNLHTHVKSIAVDSSGIIWGGTSNGILKIRKSRLSVMNFTEQSSDFRIENNNITALGNGFGSNIFIGYNNQSYDIANLKENSRKHFGTIDSSNVMNFYRFRPNEFLVLSQHDIEVVSQGVKERVSLFNRYSFLNRKLVEKVNLNCLKYNGSNTMWLGTSNGLQIIRFDSAKHTILQNFVFGSQKIKIDQIYDIEQDTDNNLWIGTNNGLIYFNLTKKDFYRYTPYDKELLNTEHKEVFTIVPDSPEIFWIGTSGGIYRFDVKSREFNAITDNQSIMNSSVKTIAIDISHNVWIGTENGLYCFRKGTRSLLYYDLKDGLLNYAYSAISAGTDKYVYLGGQQGLSVANSESIIEGFSVQDIVITGLYYIENEPSTNFEYYQVPDTIVLSWEKKPLRIDFSLLDLSRPENNRYRYSFGKTDKKPVWYQLGSQHYVILNNLSPGKYRFTVTGSNAGRIYSNNMTSLVIMVEATYWRSKLAWIVYLAVAAILITLLFRFLTKQYFMLNRENREREMFAKQIILQKEELTLKNKSITDSINYAKRIQTAMLPPYKLFKSIFPSAFILYMPKDIVSGDFYWINKLNDKIFIAAVDCTGHGVPGAFMSIIGFELFRKITNIEGLSRPSDILNRLNEDFHIIFKDVDNVVLRDGMDVAFCSIDKKDMIMEFAGAFNPLYLIRDNKITEIKGDRFSIGLDETNFKDQTFKNHLIPIQEGDIIYIFSDGFADQFGGPDGRKYKYRRFRHLLLTLHQLPMEKQHQILENNVLEWRGDQEQVDDILVIGIKIDF
jgi:ligand-binding sensor domain-containing protein/serine phosphatase RsbU (regulator of sigma subunit)